MKTTTTVTKDCYLCDAETEWIMPDVPTIPLCDDCVTRFCLGSRLVKALQAPETMHTTFNWKPLSAQDLDVNDVDRYMFKGLITTP